MSRDGLLPALLAVAGLWGGLAVLRLYAWHQLEPGWGVHLGLLLPGFLGLVLAGWMATRLARRRDHPWLMFVAVVVLPIFQPQNKPGVLFWRLVGGVCGLALVAVAVYAFVRMVARTDELERRINQEALSFAFASSLVLAIAYSLFQDLLPPLQGVWVAAAMSATWLLGWNVSWSRYR
ncbi:MAG TPA: hypothetical protein VEQ10_05325 [Vicinamibacteria bacterium]|nr:hypothetical protein [Vicinamibacteria bacterium]